MKIVLHDKEFEPFIKEVAIQNRINAMAEELSDEYRNKTPLFISMLNGAFWFTADLLKQFNGDCEISFVKFKSYSGMESSGEISQSIGLDTDINGRDIIILEDIIDTGKTLAVFLEVLKKYAPASVKIVTLLLKPDALLHDIKADYIGFEIPSDFIVGYGLDYDGLGRNYRDIYVVKK
ncbi:hypoxanthine phosphoribosyltransferase [Solitalea koreensis]|uniref:Hypoxanthine phosphoribosyltransferase n=1 Tax=Solitalea koreensis TaxID=543615 RepID=A0A521AXS5_9SPHI|nr:hypoxanthine phosphoribosyltransferase [Solitalea koreensis]SMO39541.1 hypoxanthine phosphoribosyltransferase [Solitalea koreensis]